MKWLLPIFFIISISGAQIKQHLLPNSGNTKDLRFKLESQNTEVLEVIKKVELGIQSNSISMFEHEFGSMISVSLGTTERGYVSANQIISMLLNYFSIRRPVTFEFSSIYDKGSAPYATGRLVYIHKGNQGSAQVYIALTIRESKWVINQLNIY